MAKMLKSQKKLYIYHIVVNVSKIIYVTKTSQFFMKFEGDLLISAEVLL